MIFNAGPGELFIVRTAGNVVGTYEIGSLEYAVNALYAPLVVVLGHQQCGAVKAAVSGKDYSPNLNAVLNEIRCCCELEFLKGDISEIEDKNIRYTLSKIAANENISKAVSQGAVRLLAAKYSLETGIVNFFDF
ncbi:MAG: carbonic anhydrase [Treponema sp.]|nr:carbonic anhydrase [Treponema sp.]